VTFEIPDGNHDIQVAFGSLPPVNSNPLPINGSDGDTSFEIKIVVPVSSQNSTYAELMRK
jgi:hypothetical protein